jgi:hypothetical protein
MVQGTQSSLCARTRMNPENVSAMAIESDCDERTSCTALFSIEEDIKHSTDNTGLNRHVLYDTLCFQNRDSACFSLIMNLLELGYPMTSYAFSERRVMVLVTHSILDDIA